MDYNKENAKIYLTGKEQQLMWKRKIIKKRAIALLKQNYWRMISVCFLIAILTTAYSVSTTFLNLQIPSSPEPAEAVFTLRIPNSEAVIGAVRNFAENTPLPGLLGGILEDALAILIDLFSSTISTFFTLLRTVNTAVAEGPGFPLVFSAVSVLLAFFYQILVSNILIVGERRFFLENRNYRQTPVSKIFCLYKLRCARRPAWVMFCRSLFQFLWNLTVIGGPVKHYEYLMIPYILAENPKISRKDAFYLSRQLTRRNKWKLFLLDLSFMGWHILSLFTLGLLSYLFVHPYVAASRAEIYAVLRRNYVLSRSPRYEELNDSYLEHVPSEDELLISKALYDDSQGPYTKISYFAPEQYPVFLFSVQPPLKAVKNPVDPARRYDLLSCLFLFAAFSIFGWILETLLQLITNGIWTARPLLTGPWLPVYGAYGVLSLLLLRRLYKKPVVTFVLNLLLYSALEYLASLAIELLTGIRVHDYSEFFLNLNGRIYMGGSVSFAVIGCAFLYYLAPRWTDRFMKLGHSRRVLVCVILYALFITDVIFSFRLIFI